MGSPSLGIASIIIAIFLGPEADIPKASFEVVTCRFATLLPSQAPHEEARSSTTTSVIPRTSNLDYRPPTQVTRLPRYISLLLLAYWATDLFA
jgi:hypothetical protein